MDYSTLTDPEKGKCLELIGVLLGKCLLTRRDNEFTGLARTAYLASWQEFANLLTEEQRAIAESYSETT